MIDRFGREIKDDGNGIYSIDGVTVEQSSPDKALETFNAMAPEGWINPDDQVPPLDLATQLLAYLATKDPVGIAATINATNLQEANAELAASGQNTILTQSTGITQ